MAERQESDLVTYVKLHKNEFFSDQPFNTSDGLVLAELAYTDWGGLGIDIEDGGSLTLREAILMYIKNNYGIDYPNTVTSLDEAILQLRNYDPEHPDDARELMAAILESDRFSTMEISNYRAWTTPKSEVDSYEDLESVAAVTFTYKDENGNTENYVSFRGTDGTPEGWCEDFNMAYDSETNAQGRSVWYLEYIASKFDGNIRIGGHSKGGNDAMYSYLFSDEEVRSRVKAIHSYDGPGFAEDILYVDENGDIHTLDSDIYNRMQELINGNSVCPYNSVIGQLLKEVDYTFVDVNKNAGMCFGMLTTFGVDHDAYTWKIDTATGKFVERDQSISSKYFDEVLDDWILNYPIDDRKEFMEAVWNFIYSHGDENFISAVNSYYMNHPDEGNALLKGLSYLGVCLVDNYLEDTVAGYETIRNKILAECAQRNINSPEEFWKYICEDPINNTVDFIQSVVSDWDTLVALVEAAASITVQAVILRVVVALMAAIPVVAGIIDILAIILAVIVVTTIALNFINQHWDEFVEFVGGAIDYVQEKISEFVEAMRLEINKGVNKAITSVIYQAENIAEKCGQLNDQLVDVFEKIGNYAAQSIQQVVKVANPLLYTIVRTITGCAQTPVTIDMNRLQNAVDEMARLANRVASIDSRLDSLYGQLCNSNIEKEEGVFTSLANMYHLARADISVDEGNKIRRKANAISELFDGYKDAEQWALSQIGG